MIEDESIVSYHRGRMQEGGFKGINAVGQGKTIDLSLKTSI